MTENGIIPGGGKGERDCIIKTSKKTGGRNNEKETGIIVCVGPYGDLPGWMLRSEQFRNGGNDAESGSIADGSV